ncbi:MAG: hypothetical protein AB1509_15945 [Chloroflexota bacterium]
MKTFRWPRRFFSFIYLIFIGFMAYGIYQDFVLVKPTSFELDEGKRIVFGISIAEQDASIVLGQLKVNVQDSNWSTSFLLQSQSPIVQVFLDYIAIYDDVDIPDQVCFKTIRLAKNEKVPLDVIYEIKPDVSMGILNDSEKEYSFTFTNQQCLKKGGKYFFSHIFLGSITVDAYANLYVAKVNGFRSFDFFPFDEQKIQLSMSTYSELDNNVATIPRIEATISETGWLGEFERDHNGRTILHLKRPVFYKWIVVTPKNWTEKWRWLSS